MRCTRSKPEAIIPCGIFGKLYPIDAILSVKITTTNVCCAKDCHVEFNPEENAEFADCPGCDKQQLVANMKAKTEGVVDIEIDEDESRNMKILCPYDLTMARHLENYVRKTCSKS